MQNPPQKFNTSLARETQFTAGSRNCFEYRDLGIRAATHDQYHAAISRVRQDFRGDQQIRTTGLHQHLCDLQMFCVLKSRGTMYCEDEGAVALRAGDNCLRPAGIVHNEIQRFEGFKCLENYSLANHETHIVNNAAS